MSARYPPVIKAVTETMLGKSTINTNTDESKFIPRPPIETGLLTNFGK